MAAAKPRENDYGIKIPQALNAIILGFKCRKKTRNMLKSILKMFKKLRYVDGNFRKLILFCIQYYMAGV